MNDATLRIKAVELIVAQLRADITTLRYDAARADSRGHRLLANDMRQMSNRLHVLADMLADLIT